MGSTNSKNLPYVHISIDSKGAAAPGRGGASSQQGREKYIPYQRDDHPRSRMARTARPNDSGRSGAYGQRRQSVPPPAGPQPPRQAVSPYPSADPYGYDPYWDDPYGWNGYPYWDRYGIPLHNGYIGLHPSYYDPRRLYDRINREAARFARGYPHPFGVPFDPYGDPFGPLDGYPYDLRAYGWGRGDDPLYDDGYDLEDACYEHPGSFEEEEEMLPRRSGGRDPYAEAFFDDKDGYERSSARKRAGALPPPKVTPRATSLGSTEAPRSADPLSDEPIPRRAKVIDPLESGEVGESARAPWATSGNNVRPYHDVPSPLRPQRPQSVGGPSSMGGAAGISGPLALRHSRLLENMYYADPALGAPVPRFQRSGTYGGYGAGVQGRTGSGPHGFAPQGAMGRAVFLSPSSYPSPMRSGSAYGRPMGRIGQRSSGPGGAPTRQRSQDRLGAPLLDRHAIEETTIFDQPSQSLYEGMRGMEKDHAKKKRKVIIVALIIVAIAAAVAAFFILRPEAPDQGSEGLEPVTGLTFGEDASSASSSSGSAQASSATSSSAGSQSGSSSSGSSTSSANNLAGVVVYQYTAKLPTGITYTAEETVTFNAAGEGEFVTTKMEFPDEESCKSYTDSQKKDYGANYTIDEIDGATATVTVNISGLHQDREAYEMSLRNSVEDLVVLKK